MVKNKTFNFLLQKNVKLVRVMDLNLVIAQTGVLIVVEMEEYVQIKGFLQYNKLVLNVLVVEKKLPILVMIVMDKEISKLQRKYL